MRYHNNQPKEIKKPKTFLTEDEQDLQVLIGVCGDFQVGKTVFLTSVYQTIYRQTLEDQVIKPDRFEIGGASYFEGIENEIRKKGSASGTKGTKLARLLFYSKKLKSWYSGDTLPVNLFDFAGFYFPKIADLKAPMESDFPKEELDKLHQVNLYLEKCDGLIILIDSKHFAGSRSDPGEIPFLASIKFLIDDCYQKNRPLAVVFTQKDRYPSITDETIKSLDFIKRMVLNRFNWDRSNPANCDKPFALVELITCYLIDTSTGKPKILSVDQSIWTDDAGRIFRKIFDEALQKFKQRYDKKLQRELAAERRRKIKNFSLVFSLIIVIVMGFLIYQKYQIHRDTTFVERILENISTGSIESISVEEEKKLDHLLSESPAISSSLIDKFRGQFRENLKQALEQEDFFSPNHQAQYQKYLALIEKNPGLIPVEGEQGEAYYKKILNERLALIQWQQQKEEEIKMENQVEGQLKRIHAVLDSDPTIKEERYCFSARKYLAVKAAVSILELVENKQTREILESLSPKFNGFHDTTIPYKIMYHHFRKFGNTRGAYEDLYNKLKQGITNLQDRTKERNELMEAIMQKIFRGLQVSDKRKIANYILDTLKKMSIFDITSEPLITGFKSSAEEIKEKLNPQRRWDDRYFIDLFNEPIYLRELEMFFALFSLRCYQYEAIGVYKDILKDMSNDDNISLSYVGKLEQKHQELQPPDKNYLSDTRRIFRDYANDIHQVRNLLERWNREYYNTSRDKIRIDIIKKMFNHLTRLCKRTQKPGEGDCAYEYN